MIKLRRKPIKGDVARRNKSIEMVAKEGIKVREMYMTLGRYDSVWIFEDPDEKAAMKVAIAGTDTATSETLVAIPSDEAMRFFE